MTNVELERLERKFKEKSNKELLLQLREMTTELRAMTEWREYIEYLKKIYN